MTAATRTKRQRDIARHLRALAPRLTLADFDAALSTAIAGHLRHLPPGIAAWQGLTARARHAHTDYDALLAEGYDRDSARHFTLEALNDVLAQWGSARQASGEEEGSE